MSGTLILANQYVHILNNDTGKVRMEKGPQRIVLAAAEEQIGKVYDAQIVREDQYCIINNPYDEKTGESLTGQSIVRSGPCVVFLGYKESLSQIINVHVLSKNQALRLRAIADHEDKKAGEVWQIEGPLKFTPNKHTRVIKTVYPVTIYENRGIYVINSETSQKKLVKGPCTYLLAANEELFKREYTEDECRALRMPNQPSSDATVISLEKDQVACIVDAQRNEKTLAGPLVYLLQPEESVKVLKLASGIPKKPRNVNVATVRLGPDYMYDGFECRTRDNANLNLILAYEWAFLMDPKDYALIFSIPDFIGYAAMTLCAMVREEAAKHTFEEFHNNCADILHAAIFKDHKLTLNGREQTVNGLYFPEIHLMISKVDVKKFAPVNPEINQLLNESIKSNMIIFCNKMEQEAQFKSQKEKIKTDAELQVLRQQLIETLNENMAMEIIEKAKIDGLITLSSAVADKEIDDIHAITELKLKLKRMKSEIALLNTPAGESYLELLRVKNMAAINQQWFVSTENQIDLPVNK